MNNRISIYFRTCATEEAKRKRNTILQRAAVLQEDPSKSLRLLRQECVCCYYDARVGGSALTKSSCIGCERNMVFPSTCTDRLCEDCAREYNLCRHCGSDMELKIRKSWT